MQTDDKSSIGQKGRFYLTKHIWLPQEPLENFNLKLSDMILRRMPKLPLGGEDALKTFPVLAELKKSHDKIKADLNYLLSHHEEIPALHEVHPRDLYVPGRAWRTFLLKLWGHEVKENAAAVPDTMAAIARIPGVHTALFSILHGYADPMATPDQMVGVMDELTAKGADAQLIAYAHTGHAFTNKHAADPANGMAYSASVDARSWTAMTNFLQEVIG